MEDEEKENVIKIAVSAVIFAICLIFNIKAEIKIALYIIAYLVVGGEVLLNAIKNIFKGEVFDENFLMSIATIGAIAIGEYPEAVAVMLFYQIGELFQDMATEKSKASITALMNIRPDYANVIKEKNIIKMDPEEVNVGDIVVVEPGEKIPLDGKIIDGETSLNITALTGESMPRLVKKDENILSGSINLTGRIKIKVTSAFKESTVSKILDLVENSSNSKGKAEKFITKFAKYYTPIVVILAVLLAIVPTVIFKLDFVTWLRRALMFLVISCPCALVVSIPLGFFGGIGSSSKNGVLIKGGNYLEALAKMDTIVLDKTGTLTKGNFKVTALHPEIISKDELLELAVLAESYSHHPISVSLKNEYDKEIQKSRVKDIEEISGKGIKATVDSKIIYIGNDKLMNSINIEYKPCEKYGTIIHVANESEYLGHIVIADEIKESSKEAITKLKKLGIKNVIMLTGDIKSVGESVGRELGIDIVKSELLPQDKVNEVEKLLNTKDKKSNVAFVGDGINDAPVLKRADIGIAMGGLGSDAAIEAADIVIMDDNLLSISKAVEISRKTLRIVKENIIFALLIKVIMLILGACGIANMWEAVFADVGVSIIAIINALRCIKK